MIKMVIVNKDKIKAKQCTWKNGYKEYPKKDEKPIHIELPYEGELPRVFY